MTHKKGCKHPKPAFAAHNFHKIRSYVAGKGPGSVEEIQRKEFE